MDFWSRQKAPSIVDDELRVSATDAGREYIENSIGASPQYKVLDAIVSHGPITMKGISEETGISSIKNIARLCKALKNDGLITTA